MGARNRTNRITIPCSKSIPEPIPEPIPELFPESDSAPKSESESTWGSQIAPVTESVLTPELEFAIRSWIEILSFKTEIGPRISMRMERLQENFDSL